MLCESLHSVVCQLKRPKVSIVGLVFRVAAENSKRVTTLHNPPKSNLRSRHIVCIGNGFDGLILEYGLCSLCTTQGRISLHSDVVGIAKFNDFLIMGKYVVLNLIPH